MPILLLALCVGLGTMLSAVQAGDMAVKMNVTADMDMHAHGGCDGCDGADGGAPWAACTTGCVAPALAVLPATLGVMAVRASAVFGPDPRPWHGLTAPPDPYPPRPGTLN